MQQRTPALRGKNWPFNEFCRLAKEENLKDLLILSQITAVHELIIAELNTQRVTPIAALAKAGETKAVNFLLANRQSPALSFLGMDISIVIYHYYLGGLKQEAEALLDLSSYAQTQSYFAAKAMLNEDLKPYLKNKKIAHPAAILNAIGWAARRDIVNSYHFSFHEITNIIQGAILNCKNEFAKELMLENKISLDDLQQSARLRFSWFDCATLGNNINFVLEHVKDNTQSLQKQLTLCNLGLSLGFMRALAMNYPSLRSLILEYCVNRLNFTDGKKNNNVRALVEFGDDFIKDILKLAKDKGLNSSADAEFQYIRICNIMQNTCQCCYDECFNDNCTYVYMADETMQAFFVAMMQDSVEKSECFLRILTIDQLKTLHPYCGAQVDAFTFAIANSSTKVASLLFKDEYVQSLLADNTSYIWNCFYSILSMTDIAKRKKSLEWLQNTAKDFWGIDQTFIQAAAGKFQDKTELAITDPFGLQPADYFILSGINFNTNLKLNPYRIIESGNHKGNSICLVLASLQFPITENIVMLLESYSDPQAKLAYNDKPEQFLIYFINHFQNDRAITALLAHHDHETYPLNINLLARELIKKGYYNVVQALMERYPQQALILEEIQAETKDAVENKKNKNIKLSLIQEILFSKTPSINQTEMTDRINLIKKIYTHHNQIIKLDTPLYAAPPNTSYEKYSTVAFVLAWMDIDFLNEILLNQPQYVNLKDEAFATSFNNAISICLGTFLAHQKEKGIEAITKIIQFSGTQDVLLNETVSQKEYKNTSCAWLIANAKAFKLLNQLVDNNSPTIEINLGATGSAFEKSEKTLTLAHILVDHSELALLKKLMRRAKHKLDIAQQIHNGKRLKDKLTETEEGCQLLDEFNIPYAKEKRVTDKESNSENAEQAKTPLGEFITKYSSDKLSVTKENIKGKLKVTFAGDRDLLLKLAQVLTKAGCIVLKATDLPGKRRTFYVENKATAIDAAFKNYSSQLTQVFSSEPTEEKKPVKEKVIEPTHVMTVDKPIDLVPLNLNKATQEEWINDFKAAFGMCEEIGIIWDIENKCFVISLPEFKNNEGELTIRQAIVGKNKNPNKIKETERFLVSIDFIKQEMFLRLRKHLEPLVEKKLLQLNNKSEQQIKIYPFNDAIPKARVLHEVIYGALVDKKAKVISQSIESAPVTDVKVAVEVDHNSFCPKGNRAPVKFQFESQQPTDHDIESAIKLLFTCIARDYLSLENLRYLNVYKINDSQAVFKQDLLYVSSFKQIHAQLIYQTIKNSINTISPNLVEVEVKNDIVTIKFNTQKAGSSTSLLVDKIKELFDALEQQKSRFEQESKSFNKQTSAPSIMLNENNHSELFAAVCQLFAKIAPQYIGEHQQWQFLKLQRKAKKAVFIHNTLATPYFTNSVRCFDIYTAIKEAINNLIPNFVECQSVENKILISFNENSKDEMDMKLTDKVINLYHNLAKLKETFDTKTFTSCDIHSSINNNNAAIKTVASKEKEKEEADKPIETKQVNPLIACNKHREALILLKSEKILNLLDSNIILNYVHYHLLGLSATLLIALPALNLNTENPLYQLEYQEINNVRNLLAHVMNPIYLQNSKDFFDTDNMNALYHLVLMHYQQIEDMSKIESGTKTPSLMENPIYKEYFTHDPQGLIQFVPPHHPQKGQGLLDEIKRLILEMEAIKINNDPNNNNNNASACNPNQQIKIDALSMMLMKVGGYAQQLRNDESAFCRRVLNNNLYFSYSEVLKSQLIPEDQSEIANEGSNQVLVRLCEMPVEDVKQIIIYFSCQDMFMLAIEIRNVIAHPEAQYKTKFTQDLMLVIIERLIQLIPELNNFISKEKNTKKAHNAFRFEFAGNQNQAHNNSQTNLSNLKLT